jgi:hypothetical protein
LFRYRWASYFSADRRHHFFIGEGMKLWAVDCECSEFSLRGQMNEGVRTQLLRSHQPQILPPLWPARNCGWL